MVTFDTIRDITICQHKDGYRFSVDSLLLFSFINFPRAEEIIDLGAGAGIIGILLAKKYPDSRVMLLELQDNLTKLAERNIELNGLCERVRVIEADIRDIFTLKKQAEDGIGFKYLNSRYDLAVSNPPFRKLKTGLLSRGHEKAIARHEIMLSLKDLIKASNYFLRYHGRLCIIHLPERLSEIITFMRQHDLEPRRLRFVHSNLYSGAKMVLIEAVKGGKPDLKIEKPFFIYNYDGSYTTEMEAIYEVS